MVLTEKLNEDMVGDMFETREGELVCLEHWVFGITDYPCRFTDWSRTTEGCLLIGDIHPEDVINHLPKSKYPEYYL